MSEPSTAHHGLHETDTRRAARRVRGLARFHVRSSLLAFLLSMLAAAVVALLAASAGGLEPRPARMLFVLVLAAGLWITEAVPAFAVGLLVISLQMLLLGGAIDAPDDTWETYVAVLGHPLVWLFFGGFVLGAGMMKTGLDIRLADAVIRRSGPGPARLLLGVMTSTAVLSMFMSNSATTAMMLPVVASMASGPAGSAALLRRLVLGVVVGANVGGMATLIGSPPNAIAVGTLAQVPGPQVSFLLWSVLGLPPATALFLVAWRLLLRWYPVAGPSGPGDDREPADGIGRTPPPTGWEARTVALTLLVTVGLWLSSPWTGLPVAAVSFVPTVVLTATGILKSTDVRALPWDVLLLIAGGIALGNGIRETGLAEWIVDLLPLAGAPLPVIALVFCLLTLSISNVMSNTAAANVILPIAASAAVAAGGGTAALVVVPAALCASSAMLLPISTPPNALAHGTGHVHTADLMRIGAVLALGAPVLTLGWVWLVLHGLGLAG